LQLGFEDAIEVFGCPDGDKGVRVGERGEDADPVVWSASAQVLRFESRGFAVLKFEVALAKAARRHNQSH